MAQWLTNPTRNHEVAVSVPALAQCVKDPACITAARQVPSLAWELLHAVGTAKKTNKKKSIPLAAM